jgi:hypothetical protein
VEEKREPEKPALKEENKALRRRREILELLLKALRGSGT